MKMSVLVGIVVALHVVAVMAVFMAPGCRTKPPAEPVREVAPMPEPITVQPPPRPPIQPPVRPLPVETERPTVKDGYKEYVVRPNDVVSRIAHRVGVSAEEIVQLNRLTDPNRIRVGQTLLLPPHARLDKPAAPAKPEVPETPVPADGLVHKVQRGEMISELALRYGTTVQAIARANKLDDPNMIREGQELIIPGVDRVKPEPEPVPERAPAPRRETDTEDIVPPPAPGRELRHTRPDAPVPQREPSREEGLRDLLDLSTRDIPHVVETGENLETIAALYRTSVEKIMRHNELESREVSTGQTLLIPRE